MPRIIIFLSMHQYFKQVTATHTLLWKKPPSVHGKKKCIEHIKSLCHTSKKPVTWIWSYTFSDAAESVKISCQNGSVYNNLTEALPLVFYAGSPAEGACVLVIILKSAVRKDTRFCVQQDSWLKQRCWSQLGNLMIPYCTVWDLKFTP